MQTEYIFIIASNFLIYPQHISVPG